MTLIKLSFPFVNKFLYTFTLLIFFLPSTVTRLQVLIMYNYKTLGVVTIKILL